jgi:2-iminobutanoate/2-iminopropanoate deaminase
MTGSHRTIDAPGLGRLPAFSHATVAGDFVYVSGTLGTREDSFELVEGGMAEQTAQTLRNIGKILEASGASFEHVVKMNVFVTDMTQFAEMNRAYMEFFPGKPPARITVGCAGLALGALVEIDCVAYAPS